jgi:hypothetical protein
MDMSASIAPKSDQLDAIELVAGPQTFTISDVTQNNAEQPWNFHLAEFPRPWRPGKSMLRVMAAAWGLDGKKYIGQRVTLYCDPTVQFGNEIVGGLRISHMTGIDKPLKVPLLIKRGKSAMFTVQPLKEAPAPNPSPNPTPKTPRDWRVEADALKGNTDELRALYMDAQAAGADPETLAHIKAAAGA